MATYVSTESIDSILEAHGLNRPAIIRYRQLCRDTNISLKSAAYTLDFSSPERAELSRLSGRMTSLNVFMLEHHHEPNVQHLVNLLYG